MHLDSGHGKRQDKHNCHSFVIILFQPKSQRPLDQAALTKEYPRYPDITSVFVSQGDKNKLMVSPSNTHIHAHIVCLSRSALSVNYHVTCAHDVLSFVVVGIVT